MPMRLSTALPTIRTSRLSISCCPNNMHAEYTIRAFKAGKHVLCEKPMATTIADCEAMIAAGKAARKQLMVAYRCQYDPLNLAAMRLMRAGTLGKPRILHANMGKQTDLNVPADKWRLDGTMSGGGALLDMGIYGVNAQRYLLGEEPVEVRAWAFTDKSDPRFRTVEDLIAWQMRFPSGAIGEGSTSFSQPGTMAWQAVCENGRIVADPGCFYNGNRLSLVGTRMPAPPIVEIDQFAREMDWMADVVRGRAPMVSPGEEGLQDMWLMLAMLESAAKGGATIRTGLWLQARSRSGGGGGYLNASAPAKAGALSGQEVPLRHQCSCFRRSTGASARRRGRGRRRVVAFDIGAHDLGRILRRLALAILSTPSIPLITRPTIVFMIELHARHEHDVELAVGAVSPLGAGHGDRAAHVRQPAEFGLEVGQRRAAGAVLLGIAALRHEAVDHAMESESIIEMLAGERLDPLDMAGRDIGGAAGCGHARRPTGRAPRHCPASPGPWRPTA